MKVAGESVAPEGGWLLSAEFARLAGLNRSKAREALARCHAGKMWRDHALQVRRVAGRGGAAGLQYEVRLDSLPAPLQTRWHAENPGAEGGSSSSLAPRLPEAGFGAWLWRHAIIAPALAHEFGSKARGDAVRAICATEHRDGAGRLRRVSKATVRSWITSYEAGGVGALNRKARSDQRQPRQHISRAWDSEAAKAGLDRDTQARIATEVREFIRDLWADRAVFAGWRRIADLASARLASLTADATGGQLPASSPHVCRVLRKVVERERDFRILGIHARDRKAHEDRQRPRIRRTVAGMVPMQMVLGDVHPVDIYYTRDDGSLATPKLIAWMDEATHRLFAYPVFLEKGEGVRQEHVIRAFLALAGDAHWGMPAGLYVDNGSEYNWADFINDACQLAGLHIVGGRQHRDGAIINAQPYNAAAKGLLEGTFGNLERRFLSVLPGWIGGDRQRSKREHVGKPPAPFPGSREALARAIQDAVTAYNNTVQHGRLKGRSPNAAFGGHLDEGWTRASVEEASLLAVFCKRQNRMVRQGTVSVDGVPFYNDALLGIPAGAVVDVGVPKWGDASRILIWRNTGDFLCIAEPDRAFLSGDPDGAREAARRQKVQRGTLANLRKTRTPIDGARTIADEAARGGHPMPARAGAVISIAPHISEAGRAIAKATTTPRPSRMSDADAQLARWTEINARIQQKAGGS